MSEISSYVSTDDLFCGIISVDLKSFELVYANTFFIQLLGLNGRANISFKTIAQKDDFELFLEHSTFVLPFELDIRLIKKSGEILWVKLCASFPSSLQVHCVILDITRRKNTEQELLLEQKRNKIFVDQSESVVFEYNFVSNEIIYSNNFKKVLHRDMVKDDPSSYFFDPAFVHPEDEAVLNNIFGGIFSGESLMIAEMRVKKGLDEYLWCRTKVNTIFNEAGQPLTTIGTLTDIDEEKKHSQQLKAKSETDLLTGLYNKTATENLVSDFISLSPSKIYALFSIDIDKFKIINDTYGHLVGDIVLKDIASCLNKVFRKTDVVGRFGGDEFVVFLSDVQDRTVIEAKAEQLSSVFRNANIVHNGQNIKISGSIGISEYPRSGKSYLELYTNADKALYEAKHKGRDCYCFYEPNEG